jgi:signal peptidase II
VNFFVCRLELFVWLTLARGAGLEKDGEMSQLETPDDALDARWSFRTSVLMFWMVGVVGFAVFVLDQWTKAWAVATLKGTRGITVIENFFHFTYGENTGAAFGMLRGNPTLLMFITVGVLVWLLWLAWQIDWRPVARRVAAGLIAGGALGNILDRVMRGYVVDFLDFQFGSWHYPAFNVADSAICIGVGLYLLYEFLSSKRRWADPKIGGVCSDRDY